jgi:hypothetical protein
MAENARNLRDCLPRPKDLARPSRFFLIFTQAPLFELEIKAVDIKPCDELSWICRAESAFAKKRRGFREQLAECVGGIETILRTEGRLVVA